MAPPTQAQGHETRRPAAHRAAGACSQREPGRRDPERRRQQNRQAQRKHREKAKERLARLEALHGHALQGPPNLDPGPPQSAVAGAAPVEGSDAPVSGGPPTEPADGRPGAGAPREDTASAARDAWDPLVHVDPFLVHRRRRHDTAAAAADPLYTVPLGCGCGRLHAALVQTRAPHDGLAPALVVHLDRAPDRCRAAADPYANHLRVEALCTIAALQAAAAPLGVAPEHACARGPAAASPFARPGATAVARQTAARLFASLPRDLRPGAAQIARPHPAVIDVLPFPTLRHNLVGLAAAGWGPALDAFFFDALVGLVCWARDGAGGEAPRRPWEARAWEARPWFLHRYWALLGGEAGELVRQSAWWRAARGESTGLLGA